MKLEKTYTLDAPVEKIMELVRDRSLIEDNEKARGGIEVKIEDVKQDASMHVYRVATTNYFRTKTGGEDKSKTELNTVTNEWNLGTKSCAWSWQGTNPNASRVTLTGQTLLKAKGDKTDMTLVAEVDVSIPLIGKTISKMIAEGFEKEWPNYVSQIKKRIG